VQGVAYGQVFEGALAGVSDDVVRLVRPRIHDRSLTVAAPIGAMSVSEWLCGIRDRTSEM